MSDTQKLESYMINLGLTYEDIGDGSWLINDDEKGLEQVVVIVAEPQVLIRVNVMDLPDGNNEELYKTLLELNATDLVHGAYGLEEGKVVLVDAHEYSTMDIEEFQASLDAIGLALAQHYQILSGFRTA
jgi:hypothetical protein